MLSNLTTKNRYWLGLSAGQAAPLLAVMVHAVLSSHRGTWHTQDSVSHHCQSVSQTFASRRVEGELQARPGLSNRHRLLVPSIPTHSLLFPFMGGEKPGGLGLTNLNFQLLSNPKT